MSVYLSGGYLSDDSYRRIAESMIVGSKIVILSDVRDTKIATKLKEYFGTSVEVVVIAAVKKRSILKAEIEQIKHASTIIIGGGDTREYHRFYVCTALRLVLRKASQHIPIIGISAGALLMAEHCSIWGNHIMVRGRRIDVSAKDANAMHQGFDAPVIFGRGFGITFGYAVDVHATQWGRLPRLLYCMRKKGINYGVAIDENTVVKLEGGSACKLWGGNVYLATKHGNSFSIEIC